MTHEVLSLRPDAPTRKSERRPSRPHPYRAVDHVREPQRVASRQLSDTGSYRAVGEAAVKPPAD